MNTSYKYRLLHREDDLTRDSPVLIYGKTSDDIGFTDPGNMFLIRVLRLSLPTHGNQTIDKGSWTRSKEKFYQRDVENRVTYVYPGTKGSTRGP